MNSAQRADSWEQRIVAALIALDRQASLADIYEWVERNCNLNAEQTRETRYGGCPNYQHSIRSNISIMGNKNLIVRVGRGIYRLP